MGSIPSATNKHPEKCKELEGIYREKYQHSIVPTATLINNSYRAGRRGENKRDP